MVVSQLLKLPKQTFLLSREIKNKNIVIIIVTALTVIPSFYLGFTLVRKEKFIDTAEDFVQGVGLWEGNFLLSNSIDPDTKEINLIYGGNEFDERSIDRLYSKAKDMGLTDVKINAEQGLKINDYEALQQSNDEFSQINSEVDRLRSTLIFKEHSIDSLKSVPLIGESLLKEIKAIYPSINSCSYATSERYIDTLKESRPVSLVYMGSADFLEDEDKEKIFNWLKKRLKTNSVLLRF